MQIQKNISLKPFNTFGIDVEAKQYLVAHSTEELTQILKRFYASELFVLSGGSNILLTQDIEATVLHIQTKGIKVIDETSHSVLVEAQAGENWHQFVLWCLQHDFGGVENLSLIPGCVGTSPIQNIGAYGVELKDTFYSCEAIHIQTLETKKFTKEDCRFGYRDSVFKNELKGQYIITSVVFQLSKKNHQLKTSYGAIQQKLDKNPEIPTSIQRISEAVISIRESKLPNPKVLGNSGSFFKNPVVELTFFKQLQAKHTTVPSYPVNETQVKVPAGWLIEQCGFKGYRKGDAGVHKNQALVLVNYGDASGEEILQLSKAIQYKVHQEFGIQLEAEVNLL